MIKVSETRSALRRLVLTKAAAVAGRELDDIRDSVAGTYAAAGAYAGRGLGTAGRAVGSHYSNAHNVQSGVNTASDAYRQAAGTAASRAQAPSPTGAPNLPPQPAQRPVQQPMVQDDNWARNGLAAHFQAPKDYSGAAFLDGAEKVIGFAERARNAMLSPIRPVISGAAGLFTGRK